FVLDPGDWDTQKRVRRALDEARVGRGTGGYYEFTGVPDYTFPDDPKPGGAAAGPPTGVLTPPTTPGQVKPVTPLVASTHHSNAPPLIGWLPFFDHEDPSKAPRVNVTMRLEEGKRYFVHRIIFLGNTTTHDDVIRREIRLFEGGPFNTEALKYSVKRLNQLGYFKPIEGAGIAVQKIPDTETPQVDVRLKF